MSRRTRLSQAAVAVAVVVVAAAGCGETSNESSGSDTESGSGSGYKGKGIGLAYDIGGRGDQSFNDAAYSGFEKAQKEFKIGGNDIEPSDGESDADKVQRLTQMAKAGYNPIIGVGYIYAPAVKEVSAKYPDTTFAVIDDAQVKADNVADMVFAEEQASYLAGVAAAKASKKKHVGFIGGVDIPLIHKFEDGFVQGVASVDPKMKVEKRYLTEKPEDGGFANPSMGKEAASGQVEAGADVIYHAAGLSGQGVIQEAAAEKVWAIGVDSDQYKQKALAASKDWILGSALKDVGGAVYEVTKSVVEGKPLSGEHRGDLKSGGVGFADSNPKYKEMTEVVEAVEKAKEDIISGKVTVKTD
ncbi:MULTISPECIES: BMP family lipoprotein [Streptomyces]|uniref:BMP family ABC transporter substrate-binding protein n=1 Tax=Streptomyces apricus TaxID=1828112 RepID=A0A5B0B3Y3_9ACTN|nr:BMP family ABC transporter substrate-binding protein [Streptomyces apricus]KAA0935429.1 BMP family ABC transporter substrate-binding protein [Streptomyces apricus]